MFFVNTAASVSNGLSHDFVIHYGMTICCCYACSLIIANSITDSMHFVVLNLAQYLVTYSD